MAGKKPKPRGWTYKPGSRLIRGFDSGALFREDYLLRTQWLSDGTAESERKIKTTKAKLSNREKRRRRIKGRLKALKQTREQTSSSGAFPGRRPEVTETVKITMPWNAFFELRLKHPERVLNCMNTGRVLFTDGSVILQIPFSPIATTSNTLIH